MDWGNPGFLATDYTDCTDPIPRTKRKDAKALSANAKIENAGFVARCVSRASLWLAELDRITRWLAGERRCACDPLTFLCVSVVKVPWLAVGWIGPKPFQPPRHRVHRVNPRTWTRSPNLQSVLQEPNRGRSELFATPAFMRYPAFPSASSAQSAVKIIFLGARFLDSWLQAQ